MTYPLRKTGTPVANKSNVYPRTGKHSKTKQSFKSECDIGRIVNQFQSTGLVTHVTREPGRYAFASAQTFDESMRIVAEANSQFAELPAKIRSHFENNPAKFLDAVDDPERKAELQELGLIPTAPSQEPQEPRSAPTPSSGTPETPAPQEASPDE